MDDLKEFIEICDKMYIKQIKKILILIENNGDLGNSVKNNLISSGELIIDIIKFMKKGSINVALPCLRNVYEMTLKGIVLDDNDEIRNSYNKIIKKKEKDSMDNVRRFIGDNFTKYFYVIEREEIFENILGEGILTYVYKTLCRYSHATKVNEFVYIAQKSNTTRDILLMYLIIMLIYPMIVLYIDATCTKLNRFELDDEISFIYGITVMNMLNILLKDKKNIEKINELSKEILGEPDSLFKVRIENEKTLCSTCIDDYKRLLNEENVYKEALDKVINCYLKKFFTDKQIDRLNEIVQRNL